MAAAYWKYCGRRPTQLMAPNMRLALLTLVMSLGLVAGAKGEAASWDKPGATEGIIANDMSQCRASAEKEAARRYPYNANYGAGGSYSTSMSQTRDWMNRSNTRDALFNDCMELKGYRRSQ